MLLRESAWEDNTPTIRRRFIYICLFTTTVVAQLEAVLMGVIAFGLLHGINPSHGWMVAGTLLNQK